MKRQVIKMASCMLLLVVTTGLSGQRESKPRQPKVYNLQQATSERAQLHTVAFSGLAFMTGNLGADTFFPPGKVADFFGFQYMRDNDQNEKGHSGNFLNRIANSVYTVLEPMQLEALKALARQQAPIYDAFAYKRFELIRSFRAMMERSQKTDLDSMKQIGADLYALDAELSYERAITVGKIIQSLSEKQKSTLATFKFNNSATWLDIAEQLDKRTLSHREHVCMMTYLSELFSWYAGSVEADVYFCPERHGTYFGGFYMKDYPAMGNHSYLISTSLTGDSGRDFVATLTVEQQTWLQNSMEEQKPLLDKIVKLRNKVATELRKAQQGTLPDKELIFTALKSYGESDAELSFYMAKAFTKIYQTLSKDQKTQLVQIRNQDILPKGAYCYSDPIEMP